MSEPGPWIVGVILGMVDVLDIMLCGATGAIQNDAEMVTSDSAVGAGFPFKLAGALFSVL